MKNLEKSLILLFIGALVLRFFKMPGGNILLLISCSSLSMLYLVGLPGILNRQEIKEKGLLDDIGLGEKLITNQNAGNIKFVGMTLSTIIIGILFKILHWPGAQIVLLFSMIVGVVLAGKYYMEFKKSNDNILFQLLLRLFAFALFGVIVLSEWLVL